MALLLLEPAKAESLFPESVFLEESRVYVDNPENPQNGMLILPLDHRPYFDATWDVRLRGNSPQVLHELLESLPEGYGYFVVLEDERLRSCVEMHLGASLVGGQIHYMVDKEHFTPAAISPGLTVRKLTVQDAPAIAAYPSGSVAKHFTMMLAGARQCQNFGGFKQNKLVTFCNMSLDWEAPEVLWIHTREDEREKGYARSIVTEATKFALEKRDRVYYTVDLDNVASAKTCEGLGYFRRGEIYTYVGRK